MAKTKKTSTAKKSRRTTASTKQKTATTKRKASTTKVKKKKSTCGKSAAKQEVTIDRRDADRRQESERRTNQNPVASERRTMKRREKVNRRRQIDPTTCERDYSEQELEFMNAMDIYKRRSGRMFPTCSEVLEVIRGLGYTKQDTQSQETQPQETQPTPVVPVQSAEAMANTVTEDVAVL